MKRDLMNINSVTINYDEKNRKIKAVVVSVFSDGHNKKTTVNGLVEVYDVLVKFATEQNLPLSLLCADEKKVIVKDKRIVENGVLIGFGDDVKKVAFDRVTGSFVEKSFRRSDFYTEEPVVRENNPTPTLKPVKGLDTLSIYLIAAAIQRLNPEVDIRVGVSGICYDSNRMIFSSVPADKLILPEGMICDGTTIKHITTKGETIDITVKDLSLVSAEDQERYLLPKDIDLTNQALVAAKNSELMEAHYTKRAIELEEQLKREAEEKARLEAEEKARKEAEENEKSLVTRFKEKKAEIKSKIKLRFVNKRALAWTAAITLLVVGIVAGSKKTGGSENEYTSNGVKIYEAGKEHDEEYYYGNGGFVEVRDVSDERTAADEEEIGAVEEVEEEDEMGAVEDVETTEKKNSFWEIGTNNEVDGLAAQLDTIDDRAMRYESFPFEQFVVDDDYVAISTINRMRDKVIHGECTEAEFMDNMTKYVFEDSTYFDGDFIEPYDNMHEYGQYIALRLSEGGLQWNPSYRRDNSHMIYEFNTLVDSYEIMAGKLHDQILEKGKTK